jgi:hypothetical protein
MLANGDWWAETSACFILRTRITFAATFFPEDKNGDGFGNFFLPFKDLTLLAARESCTVISGRECFRAYSREEFANRTILNILQYF